METAIPQDLTAIDDEALTGLESALVAEFDALHDAGTNDVASMTEIAEAVESVRAERTRRVEAAAAIAALAEKVRPVVAESDEDEGDEGEPEGDDTEADEAEAQIEVTAVEVAPEETTENTDTEVEETEATTEERELVTASADNTRKAPSAKAVSARTPQPEAPAPSPEVVITAAADIPGFSAGGTLDTLALAKAFHAKARTLSNHSGYVPVATVDLGLTHKLGVDAAYNMEVLSAATAPSALTAAGWCAPSNNLYDLFGIDAGDGLIDLPTVQVTRGGLNVPGFIGLEDAEDALWTWTEADQDSADEGGEEAAFKPCLKIPCPEFTDYRLVAEGLCVTAGNLTDRAFPELTQRFVSLAVNAHLHRLSAAIINEIATSATGVTMGGINATAAGSVLNAIDLQVADYRSQYRMSVNAVLEAVFPLWAKGLIRADLALRHGAELTNVTDAVVDAHFAARGIRAQFVHDYQPLFGGAAATAWPAAMEFLLYPAGGYVRGDGGVIDLGVVRDSVLNATNDYTAAWTEQLYLVAQLGPAAREVEVVLDVTGCQPIEMCNGAS
jgi:hypothetical protein